METKVGGSEQINQSQKVKYNFIDQIAQVLDIVLKFQSEKDDDIREKSTKINSLLQNRIISL